MGTSSSVLVDYRAKLSKAGKQLLDECLEECRNKGLPDSETEAIVKEKITNLLLTHGLPPIRLIRFDDMVELGTFPRCPENNRLVHDLDKIDRNSSFLVFISHCWLRGWSGAEGWDGRPHPDNAGGDKYELCVKGIKQLKKVFAPRMSECYVWLDFGCINQDGNPAGELEQLDKIVQCCDCIFTPIVDKEHSSWQRGDVKTYAAYQAKLWNDGPHAYLNRGWCRVEMLYAANIPVQENTVGEDGVLVKRHTLFESGLEYHCNENRRPHFLYGTKEYEGKKITPLLLPPLQHSYLTEYSPMKGCLSVADDMKHIEALMSELQPYLDANKLDVGYRGDVNEVGAAHGYGVRRESNGDLYEGYFKYGSRHGHGKFVATKGDVYEGEWCYGKKHGHGVLQFASGGRYEGEFSEDLLNGRGVYRTSNGAVYEGEYVRNRKEGQGIYRHTSGSVYEGGYKNDKIHGYGKFIYSETHMYEGEYNMGKRHGKGVYHHENGDVYDGHYKDGMRHGRGELHCADGTVQKGVWAKDEFKGVVMVGACC